MKRIFQRLLVVVGLSAGFLAVAESSANALLSPNHCEPVVRDIR